MGSIPVPSTKTKGCPEVARLMTSFFCFPPFLYEHERLITDIGWHGTTTCPQKGRVSRTSTSKPQLVRKKAGFHGQVAFLNYTEKKPNHHKWLKIVSAFTRCRKICNQSCRKSCKIIDFHVSNHHFLLFVFFNYCDTSLLSGEIFSDKVLTV